MNEKIDREFIKKLAGQLMFRLSDEETDEVIGEFQTLLAQLALLEKIDTAGVEEMVYPLEGPTEFLREDEVSNVISAPEALKNCPETRRDYVILPRVVK